MNLHILPIAALAASFASATAHAAPGGYADLSAIDAQVATFAGGGTVPVDRRLRLVPCRTSLALSWRGNRRDTVIVQCPDPGGWRLFVPVAGGGAAGQAKSAAPAIQRGDAVTVRVSGMGFTVSQPGEALESGSVGVWIRVRPGARREPVRARVVRPGLVDIPAD